MIAIVVFHRYKKKVFMLSCLKRSKIMLNILFISGLTVTIATASKYPSDLPRCKAADTDCLPRVITEILRNHPNGHTGLKMPQIEPIHINKLEIQQRNSPVAINLTFSELEMYGPSSINVLRVVGFEADPTTSKFQVYATIPKLSLIGKYKISGIILILSILGGGDARLAFDDVAFSVHFKPKVTEKNGKKYIQTKHYDLKFDTKRMHVHFGNLFNGNKELSDQVNWFLNDNWRIIFLELRPVIIFAVEEIAKSVINRIFLKLPYEEIYLPEAFNQSLSNVTLQEEIADN